MNRKDFFKKFGIGVGVAVVAPGVFATDINVTTKEVVPEKEIETLPGLLVAEPYFPHSDGLDGFKDKNVYGCEPPYPFFPECDREYQNWLYYNYERMLEIHDLLLPDKKKKIL